MLDFDASDTPHPSFGTKESRDPIHTVLLSRRPKLKIPPTPFSFLYHIATFLPIETPPGKGTQK
jgi:hypothetical protein